MKPKFKLEAQGVDITGQISDRVLQIRINDAAGQKSDTLDITLDDRDNLVDIPKAKAELKISVGYDDDGLTDMGTYFIDEVEITDNPATVKIRAKASGGSDSFKVTKTRAWHDLTIQEIVSTIASEHGLVPAVHSSYFEKKVAHIDQENESDAHFLTRLAKLYGATSKPAQGRLIFIPEGSGLSATGQALPASIIKKDEILTLKASIKDRGNYSGVITRFRNKETNLEEEVEVKDLWSALLGEGPVFRDKKVYSSKDMAEAAGKSKLKQLQSGAVTIDLTIVGRPDIFAEKPVTLQGVRSPMDGNWITKTVTHTFGPGGYRTKVQCGNKPTEAATA